MADDGQSLKLSAAVAGLEALTAGAAAAIEARAPGAGIAMAMTVPVIVEAGNVALGRIWARASTASGLSPQEIADRLTQLDNGVRLLSRAVDAARVAPYEEKLRVLGNSLAIAACDPAMIDQEALLVLAVAALEPPHIRLLRAAKVVGERLPPDRFVMNQNLEAEDPNLTADVADLLLGALVGQGALAAVPVLDGMGYEVTSLGQLLLERAEDGSD